jgi:hypothetical protein
MFCPIPYPNLTQSLQSLTQHRSRHQFRQCRNPHQHFPELFSLMSPGRKRFQREPYEFPSGGFFYHFARPIENSPDGLETFDTAPLMATIRAVLGVKPDEDGWRKSTYKGKELWLIPNEVRGLTLTFPDDY